MTRCGDGPNGLRGGSGGIHKNHDRAPDRQNNIRDRIGQREAQERSTGRVEALTHQVPNAMQREKGEFAHQILLLSQAKKRISCTLTRGLT